jgi:thioredoxin reductase (NADPH)
VLIENYPGYIENTGIDLAMIMYRQTKKFDIPYTFAEVVRIDKVDEHFIVHTTEGDLESKMVIWAGGTVARLLNAKNEEAFIGRGISYCAVCDGSFHTNQEVVVIGGGNSGLEEALYLSKICKKVTIVTRGTQFRADEVLMEKARKNEKIVLIPNHEPVEFNGSDLLEQVVIKNKITGELTTIEAKGAFIYIGFDPSSTILENFDILNEKQYILVDRNCETNVKGLYAAGDCIDKNIRQIATAVADGISCASAIIKSI